MSLKTVTKQLISKEFEDKNIRYVVRMNDGFSKNLRICEVYPMMINQLIIIQLIKVIILLTFLFLRSLVCQHS